ncbi:MAG: DUF6062 family protein [Treponema sp.]|jgi:hypothetical protein|nr:DUF6062 family protein [Treponema sp.]
MAIEKHINFFELQKASEKPGCPLCTMINERTHKYIDSVLFEQVTNRGFRALFKAAGGFCAFHSRNLVSFRDGLAVAILSRDTLEDRIKSFERKSFWKPKGRCPVCVQRDHIEQDYLDLLSRTNGDSPEERELRDFFLASDGLCAPHYHGMLFSPKGGRRSPPAWLRAFQEKKFKQLKARLDQFIELSAYGRQDEFAALDVKDKHVWKEAAAYLNENVWS